MLPEGVIYSIACVGQYAMPGRTGRQQNLNLSQCNLQLRLKTDLCGNAGFLAPLIILCPFTRHVELPRNRNAGLLTSQ